jgi:HD superfamily phosphohydrolase
MVRVDFADLVHQPVSFSSENPAEKLVLSLIDSPWVQRLRDISQTANTRLVYMFSEHSRFGHSLGVAYLACTLLSKLKLHFPDKVERYELAVAAAALLHDIGHLAPGSHTAVKTWFPEAQDNHEAIAIRLIQEVSELRECLEHAQTGLAAEVTLVLQESERIPAWTWQILSGASWNVDRGNWCVVDSILAGVSYGRYNVGALLDSFLISENNQLALRENRLDAMVHFAVSRNAMYRQIYQHRVILAADTLNWAVVRRARDLGTALEFADDQMQEVLKSQDAESLKNETIFQMREAWWRYHLLRWRHSKDAVLADLSDRILNRRLLKTVRVVAGQEHKADEFKKILKQEGYDPRYYLHRVSSTDMLSSEYEQPMKVQMEDGSLINVTEADSLLASLGREPQQGSRSWFVMPAEIKKLIS